MISKPEYLNKCDESDLRQIEKCVSERLDAIDNSGYVFIYGAINFGGEQNERWFGNFEDAKKCRSQFLESNPNHPVSISLVKMKVRFFYLSEYLGDLGASEFLSTNPNIINKMK